MTREKITAETCTSCGVCCVAPSQQDVFADVDERDIVRLGKKARSLVRAQNPFDITNLLDGEHQPYAAIATRWRRMRAGPLRGWSINGCAALQGDLLHKCACSVYENRPRVCRTAVRPGDRTCRELRQVFKKRAAALESA